MFDLILSALAIVGAVTVVRMAGSGAQWLADRFDRNRSMDDIADQETERFAEVEDFYRERETGQS